MDGDKKNGGRRGEDRYGRFEREGQYDFCSVRLRSSVGSNAIGVLAIFQKIYRESSRLKNLFGV